MNVATTVDDGRNATNTCMLPTRLPSTIHPAVNYTQAAIVLITMIVGITMNGFVVFLIGRHKILQKRSFYLALQLIVAHLLFSCTVLPVMFVSALLGEWRLGVFMCQLLGTIHDVVITSRYLLTFVLTVDRFLSVFFPFFYLQRGGKISLCTSSVAWIISVSRAITSLKGVLNCTNYVPTFKMCSGAPFCSNICRVHTLLFSAILALFGVLLPFLFYVVLFCKAKIIKYRLNKSIQLQQVPSLQESNSTGDRTTEQWYNDRATITFLILTMVIIGCALPPYILYTAQNILTEIPATVTILQILVGRTLIYSLAAADPIIIMRNRDVRELLHSKLCESRIPKDMITLRRFSLASITTYTSTVLSSSNGNQCGMETQL